MLEAIGFSVIGVIVILGAATYLTLAALFFALDSAEDSESDPCR